ncbi:T6SS immunity protein Tli4 family protein [Burkholderia gladioli]|uniref:T6SS immunity protein Tli4 family protein n=1 Tax=Burkholderia gladioli TaxID=28095 RepID=UPI001640ABF0|nr:T6SS immunity protein Tli4 family protein [Burkholderia gladioli]
MSNSPHPAAESMHTTCVGRYTIDLPKSATDFQIGQRINGIQIDVKYPANAELQQQKIAEDARADTDKAASTLAGLPANAPETSIFQISDDTQNLHTVRGYILKEDVLYSFNVQVLSDSVAGAKSAISKLMQAILPRKNSDTPKGAGICIEHGFIPGDRESGESVSMAVNLPEVDSRFGINFDTGSRGTKENIISRMSNLPLPLANFVSSSSTILRSESRQIAGRQGDEYDLIDKSSKAASFEWAAMPEEDYTHELGIDATLFSNGAVQDEKIGSLLGTWDVILHSLKRR